MLQYAGDGEEGRERYWLVEVLRRCDGCVDIPSGQKGRKALTRVIAAWSTRVLHAA